MKSSPLLRPRVVYKAKISRQFMVCRTLMVSDEEWRDERLAAFILMSNPCTHMQICGSRVPNPEVAPWVTMSHRPHNGAQWRPGPCEVLTAAQWHSGRLLDASPCVSPRHLSPPVSSNVALLTVTHWARRRWVPTEPAILFLRGTCGSLNP